MNLPPALDGAVPLASGEDLAVTALVFRALGHAKRLQLLQLLLAADEPLSIHQLRDATRNPSIWEHMKTLKAAGFIEVTGGPGRLARWRIVEGSLERTRRLLTETTPTDD